MAVSGMFCLHGHGLPFGRPARLPAEHLGRARQGCRVFSSTGAAGKKNSGTWKLDTQGFCTTWKRAETNCYTIIPSGKNKWSVQKGSTALAVWTK